MLIAGSAPFVVSPYLYLRYHDDETLLVVAPCPYRTFDRYASQPSPPATPREPYPETAVGRLVTESRLRS